MRCIFLSVLAICIIPLDAHAQGKVIEDKGIVRGAFVYQGQWSVRVKVGEELLELKVIKKLTKIVIDAKPAAPSDLQRDTTADFSYNSASKVLLSLRVTGKAPPPENPAVLEKKEIETKNARVKEIEEQLAKLRTQVTALEEELSKLRPDSLEGLKAKLAVAQKDAEQARKDVDQAAENAKVAERNYRNAQLRQNRLSSKASAQDKLAAFQDVVDASGKAKEAAQKVKDCAERLRQASAVVAQAQAAVLKAEKAPK